jgi:hypothetical protein
MTTNHKQALDDAEAAILTLVKTHGGVEVVRVLLMMLVGMLKSAGLNQRKALRLVEKYWRAMPTEVETVTVQ